jgi:DNA-binding transcriptional ArsR family regulator
MNEESQRFAAMFAALGHEARVDILRLLLAAHPQGLVVGEIQAELEIPPSTLSHHLDALRREGLIEQQREGRFLRYQAGTGALRTLLDFLYAECCTRHPVVQISTLATKG